MRIVFPVDLLQCVSDGTSEVLKLHYNKCTETIFLCRQCCVCTLLHMYHYRRVAGSFAVSRIRQYSAWYSTV
jgi:hypothetical protein